MQKISAAEHIAVFGGKFDPPHLAHQLIIFLLLEKHGVDEVWLFPSADHPFGYACSSFSIRCEMCRYLAAPWETSGKVKILDDEARLTVRPVYTVELMRHLTAEYGKRRYRLVIGEDNWNRRREWKDFASLEQSFEPIVIGRGDNFSTFFPLPDISSTLIRTRIEQGKPYAHLLPQGLDLYIEEHRLYLNQ